MIETYLANFTFGRVMLWQAYSFAMRENMTDPKGRVPESIRPRLENEIKEALKYCFVALRLKGANDSAVYIENLINNYKYHRYTWGELYSHLDRLWKDIDIGIGGEYFFHYPREMAIQRLSFEEEWKGVLAAFPSSKKEIAAALDCNAFGDLPGAVFHMMRVAELGLRCLARERGIRHVKKNTPLEYATWGEVIDKLEDEMEKIRTGPGLKPKKEAALEFYSGATSDLRALLVLRDKTMHYRDSYDPGQATTAILRTKSLMSALATKLTESSTRKINWGI